MVLVCFFLIAAKVTTLGFYWGLASGAKLAYSNRPAAGPSTAMPTAPSFPPVAAPSMPPPTFPPNTVQNWNTQSAQYQAWQNYNTALTLWNQLNASSAVCC